MANFAYSSSSSSSSSWQPGGSVDEIVGFRKATTLSVKSPPHSSMLSVPPAGYLLFDVAKLSTWSAVLANTLCIVALNGGVSGVRCIKSSS